MLSAPLDGSRRLCTPAGDDRQDGAFGDGLDTFDEGESDFVNGPAEMRPHPQHQCQRSQPQSHLLSAGTDADAPADNNIRRDMDMLNTDDDQREQSAECELGVIMVL